MTGKIYLTLERDFFTWLCQKFFVSHPYQKGLDYIFTVQCTGTFSLMAKFIFQNAQQIIDLNSLLQEKDREILLKDSKYVILRNNTAVKTVLRGLKDKEKVVI